MIEVLYTPSTMGNIPIQARIKVVWNSTSNDDSLQTLSLKRETLYQDLMGIQVKLAGIIANWKGNNVKEVFIGIPLALLKEGSYVVEHVISSIINSFFPALHMSTMTINVGHTSDYQRHEVLVQAVAKQRKVIGARMFAMLSSNVATPKFVASKLQGIFKHVKNCSVTVMNEAYLKKHGFGLIMGVGASGKDKPCMVVVKRIGKKGGPVIAIAGKGITFDTGGLAIKQFHDMLDMKYDKIGAVYGSTALLHLLENDNLKHVTFVGLFPLADNAISDRALKPGDVITAFNKKTVEVSNPDAEGRLVLADAFAYSQKFNPDLLIDIATLTGHASHINCWHAGYFYATDERLKQNIVRITDKNGERMLAMPSWKDYDDVLGSPVADYVNSPVRCSDAFVAALFLKQFVPKGSSWVHFDLAHAHRQGDAAPKGHGIRTIIDVVEYFLQHKK